MGQHERVCRSRASRSPPRRLGASASDGKPTSVASVVGPKPTASPAEVRVRAFGTRESAWRTHRPGVVVVVANFSLANRHRCFVRESNRRSPTGATGCAGSEPRAAAAFDHHRRERLPATRTSPRVDRRRPRLRRCTRRAGPSARLRGGPHRRRRRHRARPRLRADRLRAHRARRTRCYSGRVGCASRAASRDFCGERGGLSLVGRNARRGRGRDNRTRRASGRPMSSPSSTCQAAAVLRAAGRRRRLPHLRRAGAARGRVLNVSMEFSAAFSPASCG